MSQDQIVTLMQQHWWLGLIACLALLIGAIIRVLKSDAAIQTLPTWLQVPARYRPALAFALGQILVFLTNVIAQMPWLLAMQTGIASTVVAIAGHDFWIEQVRDGQELFAGPKKASARLSNGQVGS